jgi:chemotaxis protein methyltransferase CheR
MSNPRISLPLLDDYADFCERVRLLCGVDLMQYKRDQMERRVRAWVRRRGALSLHAYGELLRREPDEIDAFLDSVTINVSHLWRHEEQWDALAEDILPAIAAGGRVRAWSAGSSYGAEAFTLAAVCAETVPEATTSIVGTDLDKRMVARARTGEFSAEDVRTAPASLLHRHFEPLEGGAWRASPVLRRIVRFEHGDLLRMPVPRGRYDLIMCRNTVVYFTEDVRDALHARLVEALAPGGHLVVGTAERVSDPRGLGLTSPRPFIYRKAIEPRATTPRKGSAVGTRAGADGGLGHRRHAVRGARGAAGLDGPRAALEPGAQRDPEQQQHEQAAAGDGVGRAR